MSAAVQEYLTVDLNVYVPLLCFFGLIVWNSTGYVAYLAAWCVCVVAVVVRKGLQGKLAVEFVGGGVSLHFFCLYFFIIYFFT